MTSTLFETAEGWGFGVLLQSDIVTIDETKYAGTTKIDTILSTNFTVTFNSDSRRTGTGFVLHWSCTQWGEWEPSRDGTCRHVRRPLQNGAMTTGRLMYKRNETCSKLLIHCSFQTRNQIKNILF